ncbi:protease inhibitor I42 family protein [Chloroflexota bacterium]
MKIRLPILMLTAITVLMLAVACAAPSQKAWVEVDCDEFYNNHHIEQILQVQLGETFEVKLCSNPTTGFRWSEEAQISDSTVLRQENHEFIGPESEPPPPPGTPGQEVWTLNALKEGSSKILFEYSRPWEGGEKGEWTCTVNVVVK